MFDDLSDRLPRALRANTAMHREALQIAGAGLRPTLDSGAGAAEPGGRSPMRPGVLSVAMPRIVEDRRTRLTGFARLLESLGYRQVLNRGYAVVRNAAGAAVTSAAALNAGDALDIEFRDGHAPALVTSEGAVSAAPSAKPKKPKSGPAKTDQGSLF